MSTAGPWSVKGIDPKARELAKDLARRSGMTLGEWLNQMIVEGDSEAAGGDAYAPPAARQAAPRDIRLPVDGELRRIGRALDTLTQRMEAAEHRSTLAISGIDQQVMGVLSRLEGVERDRAAVAARFDGELDEVKDGQAKVFDRLRRMTDEEGPKLEAMRALEGALGKIAEKLYDTEAKTRAVLNDIREDMSNTGRRLDRIETRIESHADAVAAANAAAETMAASLGARLAEAEIRTAGAIKALEASFAGLDHRLRAAETPSEEASLERRFDRLAADLREKLEANRSDLTEKLNAAADGKLDRLESALRDLAGHVEQGERRSAQAIDRMGREVVRIAQTLGDRVASVEARTTETQQQMGGEMARIAHAMEHRLATADQMQAEALEKLGAEIAKIAERLADRIASAERRSAAALDDVGDQISRVSERLSERYEANQSALTERIRASEDRTAKLLDDTRGAIDRRLMEAQRRGALENAMLEARRAAEQEEAVRASGAAPRAADPFGADPFGEAPFEPGPFAPGPFAPGPFAPGPFAPPPRDQVFDTPEPAPAAREPEPPPVIEDPFVEPDPPADVFVEREAAPEPPPAIAAPEVTEPLSTREVVAAAREVARQAGERPAAAARPRRGDVLRGAVAAPPLEEQGRFGFALPGRKKKDPALNLRTAIVASGTAAALAVTTIGAMMYVEGNPAAVDRPADHLGPAPTAAAPDQPKTTADIAAPAQPAPPSADAPPIDTAAVALTPPPADPHAPPAAKGKTAQPAPPASPPAPRGPDAQAAYNTAVQRLQSGDNSGLEPLQKAANLGFAPAQFYLAKLYETGASAVKKDPAEARRWTQRAAEAGEPRAMHNLALYEFNGEGGAKDQADAARWFRRAADLGVIDSQFNLGRLYESGGYGLSQNKAEAYKWFLIAASRGDHGARASADALKAQLPADQAALAERAADAFVAQKPTVVETAKAP